MLFSPERPQRLAQRSRAACSLLRRASTSACASPSPTGSSARIEPAAGERARDRAGVRRPACPSPHSRSRGRGDPPLRNRGRGSRRVLRDPRDAEHGAGRRLRRGARRADRASSRGGRRARRASWPRSARVRTGEQLSEMAELASAGAAAFTDDGKPVVSAGLMRRALQYSALAGRLLALHCEEPALSRGGHAHEGRVSAEIGLGPYPSTAESLMVSATSRSRPTRSARSTSCTSPRGSRSTRCERRARGGRRRDRRGDAAPSLPARTRPSARSTRTRR